MRVNIIFLFLIALFTACAANEFVSHEFNIEGQFFSSASIANDIEGEIITSDNGSAEFLFEHSFDNKGKILVKTLENSSNLILQFIISEINSDRPLLFYQSQLEFVPINDENKATFNTEENSKKMGLHRNLWVKNWYIKPSALHEKLPSYLFTPCHLSC